MKALVLVGGFGTRLRPLTLTTPKQMLPIAGLPMIEWVVGRLAGHGISEVVLSLGYRPDAFLEAYPDGLLAGLPFTCAVEPEPRGTAGAVRFTADQVALDDTFLVLNGDVLTDLDLAELIAFHRDRGGEATIALQRVEDPSRFGVVPTSDDGRVEAFVEKPPPGTAPTDMINAGTYVLEPSVLERIPTGREASIERETFPALVETGSLYGYAADTYWLDTGTPAQYLEANLDVVSGRRRAPAPLADLPDGVSGSFLGPDCVVGANAEVRDSVLMKGCRVGAGAYVENSILGERVVVGDGARLINTCVVGSDERIPAGAVLDAVRQPAPDE